MKILVVAGGYGTRFWPASRKDNPKQLQKVISDNKSLIQLKYDYLIRGFRPEDIFIVTGARYAEDIKKQLPEIPAENFIFEPEMKDTAPAIGLSLLKIAKKFPKDLVSIQWSDHYIRQPAIFVKSLKLGEAVAKKTKRDIIIGSPPRFPTPHLGYIKIGRRLKALNHSPRLYLAEFEKFVEKPTLEVAREYVASGDYLWNLGYFIVRPQRVLEKYRIFAPNIYAGLLKIKSALGTAREASVTEKAFSAFEKQSFDYIYAEGLNPDEALVIESEMGWCDVGEWNSLKKALEKSPEDNVTKGLIKLIDCEDTLIYNYQEEKLVAAIDLKGFIIVNTADATLVCPKDSIPKVKKLLKSFEGTGLEKYT